MATDETDLARNEETQPPRPEPKPSGPAPTVLDDLHNSLASKCGERWNQFDLTITLRGSQWYWLMFLVFTGMENQRQKLKGSKEICDTLSLAEWNEDMLTLLESLKAAKAVKPKRSK